MNDFLEYRQFYNKSVNKLNNLKVKLEVAKENNKNIKELETNYEKVCEVESSLDEYVQLLKIFSKVCADEDNAYRERRIKYITSYIDKNIQIIFPDEGFASRLKFDYSRNNQRVKLTLVDPSGEERNPRMSEGMMLQQLISFSSAVGLTECMNGNKIYMDEAFSASSPENLTKVSALLQTLIDRDFQIILIEQEDDIYKDLPRREIRLFKDPILKEAQVVSTTDY